MHNRGEARIQRNEALGEAILKHGRGSHAERLHAHAEHSVAFVRRGHTRVRVGSAQVLIPAGSYIFIPAGTPHLCTPAEPSRFAYHVIYAHEAIAAALAGCTMSDDSAAIGRWHPSTVEDLRRLFSTRRAGRESGKDELRGVIERCLVGPQESYGPFRSILLPLHRPMRHADGQSRYRLFRRYKRQYAIGAHGYMQNARIEASKRLLRSDVSIAHIAAECGFFDQSHFTRTFRLYTGMSPSAYKSGL